MNTDDNRTPEGSDANDDLPADGLTPTDEEQRLTDELDNGAKGDDGKGADDAGTDGGENGSEGGDNGDAGDKAGQDADKADGENGDDAGEDKGGEGGDGAAADAGKNAGEGEGDNAEAEPAAPVRQDPEPEAPKDFDAEFSKLGKAYDEGEIETEDYQRQLRDLNREEAQFTARHAAWEERQATAASTAEHDFNVAAARWEAANRDFMSNPLRAQAMQNAIALVDQQNEGKLGPADLLEKAAAAAFEAMNYTPPEQRQEGGKKADGEEQRKAVAKAVQDRQDKNERVPDVGKAPSAAGVDTRNTGTYGQLDDANIDDLEDALAKMSPQQREDYLADAPGAQSRGT